MDATPDPSEHAWSEADYVGGHPVLDFLNTVADTGKTRISDKIATWPALRAWAGGSTLLSQSELAAFLRVPALDGEGELARLHGLRENAYEAMLGLSHQSGPGRQALARLEGSIREALVRSRFQTGAGRLRWRPDPGSPRRWHDAIALGCEELLRGEEVARLRQCARCTWLFLDRGRGAGRRWCDMRTCGNRAKAEAFRGR